MRSQFELPPSKRGDHSSGLVCITGLTCMAGQGEQTLFPKTETWTRTSLNPQTTQVISPLFNLKIRSVLHFCVFLLLNKLNWSWSVNGAGFKSAETTNDKNSKLLVIQTNQSFFSVFYNWKLKYPRGNFFKKNLPRKHICLCLLILPFGEFKRFYNRIFPTCKWVHRKMSGLMKKCFVLITLWFKNSSDIFTTRDGVWCKAKPCETETVGKHTACCRVLCTVNRFYMSVTIFSDISQHLTGHVGPVKNKATMSCAKSTLEEQSVFNRGLARKGSLR